jgi:hypothetical protein
MMADPITLATVGSVALTEGIKFLYGQAGELLKRWRERRDTAAQEGTDAAQGTEPVAVQLPATAFRGQLSGPQIHFQELARLEEPMKSLRRQLSDYYEGIETIDPSDANLVKIVDQLRQTLESVYHQRLTLQGEQRPPSGTAVVGRLQADRVLGAAGGVVAGTISGGAHVEGEAAVGTVESGGVAGGVVAREIRGG